MALTAQDITTIDKFMVKNHGKENITKVAKTYTIMVNTTSPSQSRKQRQQILEQLAKFMKGIIPNLAIKYEADTSGKITLGSKEIFIYAKDKAKSTKPAFLPKDINPSIVNTWLEPAGMVSNVLAYLKTVDISAKERDIIADLLQMTAADTKTSYRLPDFPTKLVPSEFFEILSAVKLAVLLKANDAKIRTVLGIPKKMDLKNVKLKIYIPKSATTPLIDYFISISNDAKEENALKISVKSKVSSPKANTVKFDSLFDRVSDVDRWYKELPSAKERMAQVGPKVIASSIMEAYGKNDRKTGIRASMLSIINLIDQDRQHIESVLNSKFNVRTVSTLKNVLQKINDKLSTATPQTDLSTLLTDKRDLKYITDFLNNNLKDVPIKVVPLAYLCDKILVESSRKDSGAKYNFYQMFYDEVLRRRHVAYAVSDFKNSTLTYNFYSDVNWAQEYHDWVGLRHQSSTKEVSAVIGLDV